MQNQNHLELEIEYLLCQCSSLQFQIALNIQAVKQQRYPEGTAITAERQRYPKGTIIDGENVGGQFRPLDKEGKNKNDRSSKDKETSNENGKTSNKNGRSQNKIKDIESLRGQNNFATGKKADFSGLTIENEENVNTMEDLSMKLDTEDKALEALSKRVAYLDAKNVEKQEGEEPKLTEQREVLNRFLDEHNLEIADTVSDTTNGLSGFRFRSKDKKNQAVVFTGTNGLNDWGGNIMDEEVGRTQFEENKQKIREMLQDSVDESGHLPAVSGHSLGGALSQITASEFPELIDKITIFNSAAVSKKTAEKFNNSPNRPDAKKIYSLNDQIPLVKDSGILKGEIEVYAPKNQDASVSEEDIQAVSEENAEELEDNETTNQIFREAFSFVPGIWDSMVETLAKVQNVIQKNLSTFKSLFVGDNVLSSHVKMTQNSNSGYEKLSMEEVIERDQEGKYNLLRGIPGLSELYSTTYSEMLAGSQEQTSDSKIASLQ